MKENLICCIFNYPPHYRLSIYNELSKSFNVHFYFGNSVRNENISKLKLDELPGFIKELQVHFLNLIFNFEWTSGVLKLAFKKKYNKYIITPNLFSISQWLFVFFCWVLNKEIYTWEHGLHSENVKSIWVLQRKLYYRFIKGVFLYGNRAKENMINLGFCNQKLHVIYNSLNYNESIYIRKKLVPEPVFKDYFKNNDPVLLFIGRLTKVKQLELLVDAHQILMSKGHKCNVIFIGDGPTKIDLLKQIRTNNQLDRFWFTGSIYNENQIANFLFNADLCISPGNVGLTAIHSFSYGLPVLTSNDVNNQMPEYEIIEEGLTGDFFESGSSESLALKIIQWLNNNRDRELIRNLCYEKIDKFYNPISQIKIIESVING